MNIVFVPSLTIRKLVDWLSVSFRSNGFPVVSAAPAEVILIDVEPVVTPSPTCFALIPPIPAAAFQPDALDVV